MAETKSTKKAAPRKPSQKVAPKKATPKKAEKVKSLTELRVELTAKQADLLSAKRSHLAGELVNPRVLTTTRKEIARLHTAIRAAELAEKKGSN